MLLISCRNSSRYMDETRLKGILQTLGWETVEQYNTSLLTHWLLRRREPDNKKWPRKEIRKGLKHNNFVMIVKSQQET